MLDASWKDPNKPNPRIGDLKFSKKFDQYFPMQVLDPADQMDKVELLCLEEFKAYLMDRDLCRLARRIGVDVDLDNKLFMFADIGCYFSWRQPEFKEHHLPEHRDGRLPSSDPDRKNRKRLERIDDLKSIVPNMTDKQAINFIKVGHTHSEEAMELFAATTDSIAKQVSTYRAKMRSKNK
ncbi:MAG: hypothetical protein AAF478_10445 [Pseudomonadota bacterium]